MKKKIICLLLSTLMIVTLISCESTVTKESAIDKLEGIGTITQDSEINEYIQRNFSESSNFIPLEYDNGVVKGIISPIKITDWYSISGDSVPNSNQNTSYIYKMYSISDGKVTELDEIYDLSNIIPVNTDIIDGKLIIRKGNETIYEYDPIKDFNLKIGEKFEFTETDSNGETINRIEIDYRNTKGESVHLEANPSRIDSRYLLVDLRCDNFIKQFIVDELKNTAYDLPIKESNYFENIISVYNDDLYTIDSGGIIYKLTLNNGKLDKEEVIKIELNADEFLIGLGYGMNTISDGNIFCSIQKKMSDNSTSNLKDIVINLDSKEIVELGNTYSRQSTIDAIYPKNNLLLLTEFNGSSGDKRWIVKYVNGNIEKLQMLELKKNFSLTYSVENILYDEKTNSFFLKRKLNDKDKGIHYSYEYLTIN